MKEKTFFLARSITKIKILKCNKSSSAFFMLFHCTDFVFQFDVPNRMQDNFSLSFCSPEWNVHPGKDSWEAFQLVSSGNFHEFSSRPLSIPRKLQSSSEKNENSKLLAVIARSCSSKTFFCLVFVLSSCSANTTESEKGKIEKCSWTRTSTKKKKENCFCWLELFFLTQISLLTQHNNSVKKFDGFSHISLLLLLPKEKKLGRSSLSDEKRRRVEQNICKIKIQHMTWVQLFPGQQHMMKRDKN